MSTTVLLVEDERDARESLCRSLGEAGHRCVTAASLAEALRVADGERTIDVVVTDVFLGSDERGGLDLIPALRERGIAAPIIVITAFADVSKVKFALNAGAAYLLEKPFRAPQLLGVIAKVLREPDELSRRIDRILLRDGLTEKEMRVAKQLLKGLTSSEIAAVENNSERTIRQHISKIYEKCNVSSRPELFHYLFPL
jgi:DNA-binding NarL/FixJ family response regulator